MSKLTDILYKHVGDWQTLQKDMVTAMKEYAEEYARKCLEIAADNVKFGCSKRDEMCEFCGIACESPIVYTESITQIELPPHE